MVQELTIRKDAIEKYLIQKAWSIRRNGEFVDWEDVRDELPSKKRMGESYGRNN
jgi:hypothetical protein